MSPEVQALDPDAVGRARARLSKPGGLGAQWAQTNDLLDSVHAAAAGIQSAGQILGKVATLAPMVDQAVRDLKEIPSVMIPAVVEPVAGKRLGPVVVNLKAMPNALSVDGTVYIGRPGKNVPDARFGNPFTHIPGIPGTIHVATPEESVSRFRSWLKGESDKGFAQAHRKEILANLPRIKEAKQVACFCAPGPCHGSVLREAAGFEKPPVPGRKQVPFIAGGVRGAYLAFVSNLLPEKVTRDDGRGEQPVSGRGMVAFDSSGRIQRNALGRWAREPEVAVPRMAGCGYRIGTW